MKLSEAILKGCQMIPIQCKHAFFRKWAPVPETIPRTILARAYRPTEACALGAAYIGERGIEAVQDHVEALDEYLELLPKGLVVRVAHWNDTKELSREEIAAKLDEMGY